MKKPHKKTNKGLTGKEYWEIFFRKVSQPIIVLAADRTILEINPCALELMGMDEEAVLGMKCYELFHGANLPAPGCPLEKLLLDGSIEPAEMEIETLRGTFLVSCVPLADEEGKVTRIIHIATDITRMKQAQEALRESEAEYRSLFQRSTIGIFRSTPGGTYINVNPAFARMHGFSDPARMMEEVKDIGAQIFVRPEDRRDLVRRLEQGEPVVGFETKVCRRDGEEIWISMNVRAVRDGEGKVEYYEGIVKDISERKAAEEVLRKREEELGIKSVFLEEANTALKVLLRNREEHQRELEKAMMGNIKDLVFPYLEKLKAGQLNESQKAFVLSIESILDEIMSPFLQKMNAVYSRFTPTEMQIADFIKGGKTSKEIAALLNISKRTVDTHRDNIRAKLGLHTKKINLRSHLVTLHNT
ncbi:MAG TPA: PAS domain S-box protein [Syntrophorhabdaceae bacterium]|jgi:PAS domain S-box-containing protein